MPKAMYLKLPDDMWDVSLSSHATAVWNAICAYGGKTPEGCPLTNLEIANETQILPTVVGRALTELRQKKLIDDKGTHRRGRRLFNVSA